MKYFGTNIEPEVGDKVLWAGAPAEVIKAGGLSYYKIDGTPDKKKGIADELLIRFENGALFQTDTEDSPDLEFVARKFIKRS